MRRLCIIAIALFVMVIFVSTTYADEAVRAAKASFIEARKAYVLAKEKLSDSQIEALLTTGKAEKKTAGEKARQARMEVKAAKEAYKAALRRLHEAEMARDAKIDRSPWK